MGSSCPGPPEASAGALARVAITPVHDSSPASPGHSAIAANIPSWFEYKRALPHSPHSPRLTAAVRDRADISCSFELPMPFEHERALPHSPPSPKLTAATRHRPDTSPFAANIQSWFEHERALPHSPLTYFCRGEPPHRVICDLVRLRKPAPRRRTRDRRPLP